MSFARQGFRLIVVILTFHNNIMPAVRSDLNGGLLTCLCFIMYQEYTVICIFDQMHVNLIWYLYPFMLNVECWIMLTMGFVLCLQTNSLCFQPIMAWWRQIASWAIAKMASGNGVLLDGIKPSSTQCWIAISEILCSSLKVKSTGNAPSRHH